MSGTTFKQFYLSEKLKHKHLIPPTDIEKRVDTHISKEYAGDNVYTRKTWRDKEDELHRDDGPAYILTDNEWSLETDHENILKDYPNINHIEAWYTHGMLNRENGPAKTVIKNGEVTTQEWYRNGKLHREDGPAYIYFERGYHNTIVQKFYINGKLIYSKQTMLDIVSQKIIEYRDSNNKLHREDDKPAYILIPSRSTKHKVMKWYSHGKLHRKTGPAILHKYYGSKPDFKEYYIDDVQVQEDVIKAYKGYKVEDRQTIDDLDIPDF